MDAVAVLLVLAAIFLWGTVAARLERADLAAPILFTALGAGLVGLGLVDAAAAPETLKPLAEIALVWVLFSDAARVRVQDLRADLGQYSRLLGIGLPLTILAGWGLARWLFPELDGWLALLVAAALAPTDAALGVPVVTNPAVPSRIRRLITVESGLNDGVATPVVMFAIAGAAAVEGVEGAAGLGTALAQLAIGAVIGVVIGGAGGALLRLTRRKGWVAEDFAGIAVLALALAAYMVAIVVGGNGFVAAFCGGLAFGATAGRRGPRAPRGSRPRSAPSSPPRVRPARRSPIEPSRCPGIRPPARPLPAHPWRPPRTSSPRGHVLRRPARPTVRTRSACDRDFSPSSGGRS